MVDFDDFAISPQECYEYKIIMGGWFGLIRIDDNFSGMSLVGAADVAFIMCLCSFNLDAVVGGQELWSDIIFVDK